MSQNTYIVLQQIIYNLGLIGKKTRCFLPTGSIDRIDLCAAGTKMHLFTKTFYLGHYKIQKTV